MGTILAINLWISKINRTKQLLYEYTTRPAVLANMDYNNEYLDDSPNLTIGQRFADIFSAYSSCFIIFNRK